MRLLCLAWAVRGDWGVGGKLREARGHLEEAFKAPVADFGALDFQGLSVALKLMQEVAMRVNQVMHAGYVKVLKDTDGHDYRLLEDDEWAVEEYTLKYVFVLADLIPLVFASPYELESTLAQEQSHPLLRRQRILSTLRVSWFAMLTNQSCWSIPFFGALSALARRLSELNEAPQKMSKQIQVQGSPLHAASREETFHHACAWLYNLRGRAQLENSERHFKTFHHANLRRILYAASRHPIFDLLHQLSLRPRIFDDVLLEEAPEEVDEGDKELAAGRQRLPADVVLEFYRMFHVVSELFQRLKLRWWVSHGSLIGALRDGGLSRHADDLEVDLTEEDAEALQTVVRRRLRRNGLALSYDPRGRCFKVWPLGSAWAEAREAQLRDQSWWLPQQRVGTPQLDIYLVQNEEGDSDRFYVSNDVFHCNPVSCQQYWKSWELRDFREVPFGLSWARVPLGAASYLERVYGGDWNVTVRPHGWAAQRGEGFEATAVNGLRQRRAEPVGPLPMVL